MTEKNYMPEVFAKCRRGNDQVSAGQECPSNRAFKMSPDHSQSVQFKCASCGYSWSVAIGGSFNP